MRLVRCAAHQSSWAADMARIELAVSHAYGASPERDEDYALRPLELTFEDGGAYALLGPSGCGKTTMLNVMSGLLTPSRGVVRFDGVDVTARSPQARNIAQVFQFPVVYDTMSVADNLAFPLRNRGMAPALVKQRVGQIAELLDLSAELDRRASHLTADAKQRISLGRGLVREDVSAVLFDEPLTVIDPQLKWHLRRKLKQIHAELKLTLIYVTHDQVEALTFADEIVVMSHGTVVQIGSAVELYKRPAHTFVGHFIGSPGMQFVPTRCEDDVLLLCGQRIPIRGTVLEQQRCPEGPFVVGVRPEYLTPVPAHTPGAAHGIVTERHDVGTYWLLTMRVGTGNAAATLLARVAADVSPPALGADVWLLLVGAHTCVYVNDHLLPDLAARANGARA